MTDSLKFKRVDRVLFYMTMILINQIIEMLNDILNSISSVPTVSSLIKGLLTMVSNLTTNLNQTIDVLKDLRNYIDSLPGVISEDGSSIAVNLNEGLGGLFERTYAEIFSRLVTELDQFIHDLVSSLPILWIVLNLFLDMVLSLLQGVVNGTSPLTSALLNAKILEKTNRHCIP